LTAAFLLLRNVSRLDLTVRTPVMPCFVSRMEQLLRRFNAGSSRRRPEW